MKRDLPELLLAAAVRLLPADRRDWGRAMRAELSQVGAGERWSFATGCVRTVFGQRVVWRELGYDVLAIAAIAAAVWFSSSFGYAPLRWGIVALFTVLVAIVWASRSGGVLAPRRGPAAITVRASAFLVVGFLTFGFAVKLVTRDNDMVEKFYGVEILGGMLTAYLLGFVALTAQRSRATGRALATGFGLGLAATAIWCAVAVLVPPMPKTTALAVLLIGVAMAVAAAVGRDRSATAALSAGAWACVLIFVAVILLGTYGPASLIPDLAPAALTPADDLAQSRNEIQDPYVVILFLGAILSAAVAVTSLVGGRKDSPAEHAVTA